MERIKGGFPPLVSRNTIKKTSDQKEMKSQFFAEAIKKNVNIKELLVPKTTSMNLDIEIELKVLDTI